jgi:hypothetical protein
MPRYHPHTQVPHEHENGNHDEHEEQDNPIYATLRTRNALELRARPAMAPPARFPAHFPRIAGLAAFVGDWRKPKITQITTTSCQLGAGETERRTSEQSRDLVPLVPRVVASGSERHLSTLTQPNHLPTTRMMPVSEHLVPPSVVAMVLFESSRLLFVDPAAFGVFG